MIRLSTLLFLHKREILSMTYAGHLPPKVHSLAEESVISVSHDPKVGHLDQRESTKK